MSTIANLIIAQGENAARARSANAAMWGRATSEIAQIPGNIYALRMRQKVLDEQNAIDRRNADTARMREEREAKTSAASAQRDLEDRNREIAAAEAARLQAAGSNPADVQAWIQSGTKRGLWAQDEGAAMAERAQTPDGAKAIVDFIAPLRKKNYQAVGGGVVMDMDTGKPVYEPPADVGEPFAPFGNGGIMDKRSGDVSRQPTPPQEPREPTTLRPGEDDPELPRGVQDYLLNLTQKPGYTYDQAKAELDRALPELRRAHPRLDTLKMVQALRTLFQADPARRANDDLDSDAAPPSGAPAAPAASAPPPAAAASAVPPYVTNAFTGKPDGDMRFSDGSVWRKQGNAIARVK